MLGSPSLICLEVCGSKLCYVFGAFLRPLKLCSQLRFKMSLLTKGIWEEEGKGYDF